MNTETTTATEVTKSITKSTKGPGRPKAVLKYPRGSFTFAELYELNRGEIGRGKQRAKVCELTVRNHIKAQLASGFLTRLEENVDTGKPGQPAHRYIRTSVKAAAEARAAARKTEGTTPTEAPAAEVSLTEAPATEAAPAVEVPVTV